MISILQTKFRLFFRKPLLFIGMTAMSMLFAFFIGGSQYSRIAVPIYTDIDHFETTDLWKELKDSKLFQFTIVTEAEAKKQVSEGERGAAVKLMEDGYEIVIAAKTSDLPLIRNYLQSVYSDFSIEKQINEQVADNEKSKEIIKQIKNDNSLFTIHTDSFRGKGTVIIDNQLQILFGTSLFFVIYTISYNVLHILQEKLEGVWDRLILSPLKKWQMYAGNLAYSFLLGYIQVALLFFVFRYFAGVNFYEGFVKTLIVLIPYVFSIVSLSMFLVGVVKNIQQFNALIPLISVSMAMIGGAYWPLEIVSSPVLLKLADFMPIKYGMEALKGATIYGESWGELLQPMSILILMGVVFVGIGINVMEKRST
ncbi:ABC transporter permease [Caldibacillus thermoamylovorans]|uniref:ABC transporter permease n=1 Tax=Caldibacillus thermoamylovorans TaxID=35841 RepID=UPI00203AF717|nr:ABC transporter permease [Caldibacillus thermoamylovorans]MCM3056441.1 ABC transporter permease [Caldibacillus thermoamylovorans]